MIRWCLRPYEKESCIFSPFRLHNSFDLHAQPQVVHLVLTSNLSMLVKEIRSLIECDGHYMLIDGGDKTAGDKVYNVLEEKGIQKLDILAISHMHGDHIGGLVKALTYASSIKLTLSNTANSSSTTFLQS